MISDRRCKTCQWFEHTGDGRGYCHANPPTVIPYVDVDGLHSGETYWPEVGSMDYLRQALRGLIPYQNHTFTLFKNTGYERPPRDTFPEGMGTVGERVERPHGSECVAQDSAARPAIGRRWQTP
jgi:hypothetical protein